jgi:hypothetical protein
VVKVQSVTEISIKWGKTRQAVYRTHSITVRCVRLTIFAVSACSLIHPAYKAHALCYIVIYGLPVCTIFFHIIS